MAVAVQSSSLKLEIQETFPKQTYRNRCNIATATGILSLTVPVKRVNGNHTKTCEIQIDNSKNWQQLHWKSIITAYNQSPYLLFYRDLLEPLFVKKFAFLVDLDHEFLNVLLKILNINFLEIFYTHDYTKSDDFIDLRNSFHPKKNTSIFTGILPRYIQVFEAKQGFISELTILDLLFNIGPDAKLYLLELELQIHN